MTVLQIVSPCHMRWCVLVTGLSKNPESWWLAGSPVLSDAENTGFPYLQRWRRTPGYLRVNFYLFSPPEAVSETETSWYTRRITSHVVSSLCDWVLALVIQIALNCPKVRKKFLHAGLSHGRWSLLRYKKRALPLRVRSSSQGTRRALLKIHSLLRGRTWLNPDGVCEIWIQWVAVRKW